jgi:hypothetical protein
MFGKRDRPPVPPNDNSPAPSTGSGSGGGGQKSNQEFPWANDPDDQVRIACNLAAGNLANNLASRLTLKGRIQAETYVAAAGAIAGFAAQCSLMATADAATLAQLHIVTTKSGTRFLFGDPLNDALLARDESEANGRVWSMAVGGAIAAGLGKAHALDLDKMFAHISSAIGGDKEGLPSVPETHQPQLPARELLKIVWPMAAKFFAADFDEFHRRFGPVPKKWWGAVAAFSSARPIIDVKDVLAPDIALTILMETAIYASKLDRSLFEGV